MTIYRATISKDKIHKIPNLNIDVAMAIEDLNFDHITLNKVLPMTKDLIREHTLVSIALHRIEVEGDVTINIHISTLEE